MDIEWGKDGASGKLYILQARPETVQSRAGRSTIQRYTLKGTLAGAGRGARHRPEHRRGPARVIRSAAEMARVQSGDVLVTDMTDPDWEPVMKRAAAIVTNRGGRTCHAAIIARELGIAGGGRLRRRHAEDPRGPGGHRVVRRGRHRLRLRGAARVRAQAGASSDSLPKIPVKIMMNVGNPDRAFDFAAMPNGGVGLARLEFIINSIIGVHPQALLDFDRARCGAAGPDPHTDGRLRRPAGLLRRQAGRGHRHIAAAFSPKPVIVRLSDFKSQRVREPDRRRALRAGRGEPDARLPRRRALRDESFRPCFELECRALQARARDMGLTNVQLMVPFVRTLAEAREVDATAGARTAWSAARRTSTSS